MATIKFHICALEVHFVQYSTVNYMYRCIPVHVHVALCFKKAVCKVARHASKLCSRLLGSFSGPDQPLI